MLVTSVGRLSWILERLRISAEGWRAWMERLRAGDCWGDSSRPVEHDYVRSLHVTATSLPRRESSAATAKVPCYVPWNEPANAKGQRTRPPGVAFA